MSMLDPTPPIGKTKRRTGFILLFIFWLIAWLRATQQLPNALTVFRVVFFWAPAVFILLHPHDNLGFTGALASFVLLSLTDLLDGKLARKWSQVSNFGKLWDPAADKLLIGTVLLALCWTDILTSPWGWAFAIVTITREVLVSLLRWLKERGSRNLIIPANGDGKIKMSLQVAGVIFAIIAMLFPYAIWLAWACLLVSLYYSLKSAVAYVRV